jgi:hypothetical protein
MLEQGKVECQSQTYCLDITLSVTSLVFFQDRDLERLRRKWLNALTKRQEYLDQQLQKLVSKPGRKSKWNISLSPYQCRVNPR